MTSVLSEIGNGNDMDDKFCETNFQAEGKKRKDKPYLLQELGLKRDAQDGLVNYSDNNDEQTAIPRRTRAQTQAARKSVNKAQIGLVNYSDNDDEQTTTSRHTRAQTQTASKSVNKAQGMLVHYSDNNDEQPTTSSRAKEQTQAASTSVNKAQGGLVNYSDNDDEQPTTLRRTRAQTQAASLASAKLAKNTASADVKNITIKPENIKKLKAGVGEMSKETSILQVSTKKFAPDFVNVLNVETEVKQPKAASQGAIHKVTPGSVKIVDDSNGGIDLQIITEQGPTPVSIVKVAVGNVKVANANVEKTEVKPPTATTCNRSNSLIKRTKVEYERLCNLLIKHKTDYVNINGNRQYHMVLMDDNSTENFMLPFLECEEKNLKEEADLLQKYRCMLEDALAKNNPAEYNKIITRYNIRKRGGTE